VRNKKQTVKKMLRKQRFKLSIAIVKNEVDGTYKMYKCI